MSHENDQQLFSGNADYIESLYEQFLVDPNKVSKVWQDYFKKLNTTADKELNAAHNAAIAHMFVRREASYSGNQLDNLSDVLQHKQMAVLGLVSAYRRLGHRQADIDPLYGEQRLEIDLLKPEYHGLTAEDLDKEFYLWEKDQGEKQTLRNILNLMSTTYCGSIGAETEHVSDPDQKEWLRTYLETHYHQRVYSSDRKKRILNRLIAANAMERHLHRKYVGQKRFSLEGGTSLIPLLDTLIQEAGEYVNKEVIIGMAHRGRLNVLVNIMGKSPQDLFEEFEGTLDQKHGSGDVKYHKGFSINLKTSKGNVHTVLAFNPSHLEIVNPVIEGSVRARQDRRNDAERNKVLPVLIHGDAAFAGQGVVMETLNLSSTRGYTTGGTVHIVVNNQIGFTTSDPLDSRSTLYCTDVAKMVQAPIFHVNGDDPEAVVFVTELAMKYRMKYSRDVVIDMICYRKHGHSEADEPFMTQPLMYQRIKHKASVDKMYFQQLTSEGVVREDEYALMEKAYIEKLNSGQPVCSDIAPSKPSKHIVDYKPYIETSWEHQANTTITEELIEQIGDCVSTLPEGFTAHKNIQKVMKHRKGMSHGKQPIDWGFAEMLVYGSLLKDGFSVRLSGQDSIRGTFAHRHCAVYDQNTGEAYLPLRHFFENQPDFLPINSLLSEEAVLGYELGYATSEPEALVIWEAQFGDFANGAQVIVDQFLSSSEVKWQRLCGLVLFLPHGYDGQGPEHSSARLERYLQLCAEENIQVCIPATPAQLFHLLRRQMLRPYRKPLFVFTPKSMLRNPISVSNLEEFTQGKYHEVIVQHAGVPRSKVSKLIICTGKIYYELLQACEDNQINDVTIIRLEQLYPFPEKALTAEIKKYEHVSTVVWAQEEPRNQGAWFYMISRRHLPKCLFPHQVLRYAGRDYSASPATGHFDVHIEQQRAVIHDALELGNNKAVTLKNAS
ncbi:MAG: 2-oxoglutarate dehydrogenase E1 component [Pseudomonadota bacterium]